MRAQVIPFPAHRAPAPFRQSGFDGNFYDDELPPELFDEDEDREDLNLYVHIAEIAQD